MIRLRLMTDADLPLGMRLKEQAGWNQTEADWRRFLALQPDGCFVAEWEGAAVGTATTCIFGDIAWIAMVLVEKSVRGRGVGTALMRHALAFLDQVDVRSVRLDATPLGRPLYEKLGFVEEYTLARFEGVLPETSDSTEGIIPTRPEHVEKIVRLDRMITATDRGKLLARLYAERPDEMRVIEMGDEIAGYLTTRAGARALLIGPCLASAGAGSLLLADAWRRHAGQRVFLDVPLSNTNAVAWAEARGLTVQRPLLRMCRGPRIEECVSRLWASSGPEKG